MTPIRPLGKKLTEFSPNEIVVDMVDSATIRRGCFFVALLAGGILSAETERYFLSVGSWDKYLQESPKVLIVNVSPDVDQILAEGERILVNLFDAERLDPEAMVAEKFQPDVESLRNETPDVVTSEGYSKRWRTYRHTYSDSTGSYVGSAPGFYYEYRTKEIQRSTSPDLVREVRWAVQNIDLESIESKIELLRMSHRKWTERTGRMPGSGSSRLVREANFTYLARLKDYISAWSELNAAMDNYRQTVAKSQRGRSETLREWEEFEANELEALHLFFEGKSVQTISSDDGKLYLLPEDGGSLDRVLACEVSGRRLYFRLNPEGATPLHPFGLIPVGSGKETGKLDMDPFASS